MFVYIGPAFSVSRVRFVFLHEAMNQGQRCNGLTMGQTYQVMLLVIGVLSGAALQFIRFLAFDGRTPGK